MGHWRGNYYVSDPPKKETRAPVSIIPATEPMGKVNPSMLAGGRVTMEVPYGFQKSSRVFLPPRSSEADWRNYSLDDKGLSTLSPSDLIDLLADLSPDVSKALWDFLRMCNPGWQVQVFKPGGKVEDPAALEVVKDFIGRLHDLYGTIDVVIGKLFAGAFMRGAFMSELVLDERGIDAIDLATPDPLSVRFALRQDDIRGQYWQLGQYQPIKGFVEITRPTVRYIPLDPMPSTPYGRAPAAPALFASMFLLGLLHDLRRVVAQQGYPRLDISVSLEGLREQAREDIYTSPQKWMEWVNGVTSEVQSAMDSLEPDDLYVHADSITVNRPVGAVDSSSLGAVDGLISMLERMLTRALKTMPLLMGTTEGMSEASANRQWELYAAGIKSVQHLCETMLERLFTLAINAAGKQGVVVFRFAELRAAELLRDAQTFQIQLSNAYFSWAAGFTSLDEAAQSVVAHPADTKVVAGEKWPRLLLKGMTETPQEGGTTNTVDTAGAESNQLARMASMIGSEGRPVRPGLRLIGGSGW